MTKKTLLAIANLLYRTKALVSPTRVERMEWNELREQFKRDTVPADMQAVFDGACPPFRNV